MPALLLMAARPASTVRHFAAPAGLLLALCLSAELAPGASPVRLTGSLLGTVKDVTGVPQMGATVLLFSHYEKLVSKAITNLKGDFLFDGLPPDTYSLRVTMTSFVPALKRNILVQPGMQSVMAINLASFLSSIELVYSAPQSGPLMTDEWKWVLRSSMSTRPVLRAVATQEHAAAVFSDTTALLRVSSGESSPYEASNQPDLGTAFALATSFYGHNRLQFSGNIGYTIDSSMPTTGFRTTFSRNTPGVQGPEVKLTMQQAALPLRTGVLVGGQQQNAPALRSMTVTMIDRTPITDGVELEYGASLESVTFFDRLNFISPFARLSYDLGGKGKLAVGYSSGAPPLELLLDGRESERSGLQQDLAALAVLPRVSLRDGRAKVQRNENVEVGYQFVAGSRTFSVGAYHETVRNGALTIAGAEDLIDGYDLLPELSSHNSIFNIGGYSRYGYSAAVTQALGDDYSVMLAYGNGGVLRTDERSLETDDPSELRGMIQKKQQRWVTGRMSGVVPVTGTRVVGSYQWTDYRALTPAHVYFTQPNIADAGLNLRVRQPIPSFPGLPGRLEATADMRNLLAQGYLPITTLSGRRMLLTHSPRAVRGGLSFIF